jgi:hypothetical protein
MADARGYGMIGLLVSGLVIFGSGFIIYEFWGLIEQPLIDLVVLGAVPGTSVVLDLDTILLGSLTWFVAWLLWEAFWTRRDTLKLKDAWIEQQAI